MRSLFTCLVILFPIVSVFAQAKDIEALRQINVDLNNATVAKDTAVQGHIFADDMLLTNPAGETYNKQQLLKRLAAGPRLLSLRTMSAGFADMHYRQPHSDKHPLSHRSTSTGLSMTARFTAWVSW